MTSAATPDGKGADFKLPRQDVTGTDRSDLSYLSLAEPALGARAALIAMAAQLRTACEVADPAPAVQRMYERMIAPRPGDLVVELSALSAFPGADLVTAFGILVEHRQEWATTDEHWHAERLRDPAMTARDRVSEDAWYIQYGPAAEDLCRWVNCTFMALPIPVNPPGSAH
ncbi:hypothetical protein CFP71_09985 [Amycolatopsis thailandensis]|uniref:Uncharacterized protein n=1 Tax=Amycolatopsis thailandensis TaxID=589330 RepID=A0A229SDT3_9PSEU|nr:hypothetical protein [Amycolatopsis thailandensis]OXM57056.1 hypothetical protein CFP71_09985 [Amycolatopsis thailandensis]